MNVSKKNLLTWLVILVTIAFLYNMFDTNNQQTGNVISYSEFLNQVELGNVRNVTIDDDTLAGTYVGGGTFNTYAPSDPDMISNLRERNVSIEVSPPDSGMPTLLAILINWFPMLLLIGVWIFLFRQMQGGGRGAMGFGKSRARLLTEQSGKVTFEDVAGIDESKQELQEVVEFLKDPQKFSTLGGKIPKGVLLIGPPGTGKTLTARAVAGEADVPFFTISGSDFVEMFVGVGASRVRDMFEQGKKSAPCIIFIDEIDAVGRHRGAGLGGGNDEREQTLNQLLVEMDGFESSQGVIIIAATNRPDVLDPALLRPGRFDRQVVVPNPDINGREKILLVHMRDTPLAPDVSAKVIARGTPGFSGADLANLVNEAALLAARRNRRVVSMREMEDAKDKVLMGAERRSLAMSEEEKKLTAYHEAGHALVGLKVPGNDPLHKVTIIPRGRALGVTMNLPERDRLGYKKSEMTAKLAMIYGGREAEDIIFGAEQVTTGASNDIMQATRMARAMVTEYGMSDKLGALRYNENQDEVFLGHSVARQQNISEQTAQLIDEEVRRLCETARKKAREILDGCLDELHLLSKALLEHETLSGEEVDRLLRGESIREEDESGSTPTAPSTSAFPQSGEKSASKTRKKSSRKNPAGSEDAPDPDDAKPTPA